MDSNHRLSLQGIEPHQRLQSDPSDRYHSWVGCATSDSVYVKIEILFSATHLVTCLTALDLCEVECRESNPKYVYVKTEFRMYFYILNKGTYGHIRQLRSSVFQFHHRISSRNTRSKLSKSGLSFSILLVYTDSIDLSNKKPRIFDPGLF